ncbi:hypothetical protein J2T60_000030 [Natronospira proteinivora]|uniref:Exo-alpha-sialidase n=1 Tax=Natronospira proteinivora TaxID=1807133 RepID=A0ABT1G466_9GAMM|nr:hypothetical protein [Natronospira proteinivora]MCP1726065.1 hypothetical protein [Natronospira proteinivora]
MFLRTASGCLVLGLIIGLMLSACGGEEPGLRHQPVSVPSESESFAPRLSVQGDQLYLSWLAVTDSGEHALRFARYEDNDWSSVRTVAQGKDWFANWADTPGVRPVGAWLFAHWLVRSGPGTYDYDIHAAWSNDEGESWGEPFILHRDGVQAEHGFLSSVVLPDGDLAVTWLDGRHMAGSMTGEAGHDHHEHHEHNGPMTLRWQRLVPGQPVKHQDPSQELDDRVCDCCMTASVLDEQGPLVFYRDRSESEVRDIAWQRPWLEDSESAEQSPDGGAVADDDWEIAACPVNGPAAARSGDSVGVAWFTAAQEQPRVLFTHGRANEFADARRLDEGRALGRTTLSDWPEGGWLAVWMERLDDDTALRARLLDETGKQAVQTLASIPGSRQSGFPVSVKQGDSVFLAWTDMDTQGKRRLRLARLSPGER